MERREIENLKDQVKELELKKKDHEKEAETLLQQINAESKDRERLIRDLMKVKQKIVLYEAEQKDVEKLEKKKTELEAELLDLTMKQEVLMQRQDELLDEGRKEKELRENLETKLRELEKERKRRELLDQQVLLCSFIFKN